MPETEETLNQTIGDRIKSRREELGMSTAGLASEVGLSEAAIKKIEGGGSTAPSFQNALKISKALKVDPWRLAFGTEPPAAAVAMGSGSGKTLLATLLTFREEDRGRIIRLLELHTQTLYDHHDAIRDIQSILKLEQLPPLAEPPNAEGVHRSG